MAIEQEAWCDLVCQNDDGAETMSSKARRLRGGRKNDRVKKERSEMIGYSKNKRG